MGWRVKKAPVTEAGGLCLLRPDSSPASLRLMSDLHVGAANADYALMVAELEEAKAAGDRVLINGDVFDMILSKDLKRFSPQTLHPAIRGRTDLVNAAVEFALELFSPYAGLIDLVGCGNHETYASHNHSVDPTKLFADALGAPYGGYQGFVRYATTRHSREPFTVFYWHGAGGGAGLGGQLGEFGGKGTFVEGADVSWYGHRHCKAVTQVDRVYLKGNRLATRQQFFLRTGGYLVTYGEQSPAEVRSSGRRSNYAADALHTPYGRGGLRVVFSPAGRVKVEVSSP